MAVFYLVVTAGFILFWTVLLAVAAKRMLELRVGPVRLVLCGVAGVAASAMAIGQRVQGQGWPFALLWIGIGMVTTMSLLTVGEVVAPAGAGLRPIHWYRAFRDWRWRVRRYAQVSRIAVRYGLGRYTRGRSRLSARQRADLAHRLRLALDEAGVAFVKFGQILSTRHDLLPQEFVTELGHLHSQVAAVDWTEIEELLVRELGAPVAEVFAEDRKSVV